MLEKPKIVSSIAFPSIHKAKGINTAVVEESIPSPAFQWSRDSACTLSHSTASVDDNEVDFSLGLSA